MTKKTTIVGGKTANTARVRIPREAPLPNPIPVDIYEVIRAAAMTSGLATMIYKLIRLWIEDRKARKILIKKGDLQLEIHGGMTVKEIQQGLRLFRKSARIKLKREVDVIVPPKCDPDIPLRLWLKSREK